MAKTTPNRTERQQLAGLHVAITRPAEQARDLADALEARGARVTPLATIAIAPVADTSALDEAVGTLATYDWIILTSVNGVAALSDRLAALGLDWSTRGAARFAVIGPATASALQVHGVPPDLMPDVYIAEAITAQLGVVAGLRILLLRADIARQALADDLRRAGALVTERVAYRTVVRPPDRALLRGLIDTDRPDVITFTSSSTVLGLLAGLATLDRDPSALHGISLAAIGPVTANTLRAHGLTPSLVAEDYTIPGLVRALIAHHSAQPSSR